MNNITPFKRQNERTAIIMRKAAHYCLSKERQMRYTMISMSVFLCVAGIVNRYLDVLLPQVVIDDELKGTISTGLMLAGGLLVVFQIFMSRFAQRMSTEGANILERCDCYVFDLPQNKSILRPIPETVIETYALRVRKKDDRFLNSYYAREDSSSSGGATNILKYQRAQFEDEYRLLLSVHSFYMTIWIAFCLFVLLMAVTTNSRFLDTLANILIPSLSAIVMIFNSSHSYNLQIQYDRNSLAVIDEVSNQTPLTMQAVRNVQDGLFANRLSSFLIPAFLAKKHKKKLERDTWGYDVNENKVIKDFQIRRLPNGEIRSYDVRTRPIDAPKKSGANDRLDEALFDEDFSINSKKTKRKK